MPRNKDYKLGDSPTKVRVTFWNKELTDALKAEAIKRVQQGATLVLRRVRGKVSTNAPPHSSPGAWPHRVSGLLGRSYRADFAKNGLSFKLTNSAPQSKFMQHGVKGGKIIRPTNGKFLSWIDPTTGERRFAKEVRQGRIAPRPHLDRVLLESRNDLKKIWEAEWRIKGLLITI